MTPVAETSKSGGKTWIGYAVAACCLVWVLHDVRWADLFARVITMKWWLLVPAVAADIGSYLTQGARWSLLLRPLGRLSIFKSTQAVYAALFTNELLPLRVGELLRGYLASRWTSLPMTSVFSSILVERFLDGVWMVLAFGAVVLAVPLPRYLVDAEGILAFVIFAAAAVLICLVARKERQMETGAQPGAGGPLQRRIEPVAAALRSIGGASSFYAAAALSGLLLGLQILSFWLVMEAYGMSLSIWHGAAVFLIVHLGTMAPGAPSNVGTYQFFTVLGLMLFGVDKTVASGFSLVVFLILTVPLWAIGLFAFGRTGLDLQTVRKDAGALRKMWRTPSTAAVRARHE